jgi:hypothetical protein
MLASRLLAAIYRLSRHAALRLQVLCHQVMQQTTLAPLQESSALRTVACCCLLRCAADPPVPLCFFCIARFVLHMCLGAPLPRSAPLGVLMATPSGVMRGTRLGLVLLALCRLEAFHFAGLAHITPSSSSCLALHHIDSSPSSASVIFLHIQRIMWRDFSADVCAQAASPDAH